MVGTIASAAWLLVTLLACGHGYQAGTLETNNSHVESGDSQELASCLEMRVSPHSDERLRELGWLGVAYEMGNSCDGAVPVDLSSALVLATPARPVFTTASEQQTQSRGLPEPAFYANDVGSSPIVLPAWDPQEVIRGAMLDGRRTAREVIAYVVPPGLGDLDVCVEIEGVQRTCFRWLGGAS